MIPLQISTNGICNIYFSQLKQNYILKWRKKMARERKGQRQRAEQRKKNAAKSKQNW